MRQNKLVLEATAVRYYSQFDEASFFAWLDRIPCVDGYTGRGETLYITVDRNKTSDDCLRELVALFFRYGVDMKQLSIFSSDTNRAWFESPNAYWYDRVFTSAKSRG
jgi:hypothetical protein